MARCRVGSGPGNEESEGFRNFLRLRPEGILLGVSGVRVEGLGLLTLEFAAGLGFRV